MCTEIMVSSVCSTMKVGVRAVLKQGRGNENLPWKLIWRGCACDLLQFGIWVCCAFHPLFISISLRPYYSLPRKAVHAHLQFLRCLGDHKKADLLSITAVGRGSSGTLGTR